MSAEHRCARHGCAHMWKDHLHGACAHGCGCLAYTQVREADMSHAKTESDQIVEALAKALCDSDPTSVTDATWRIVREEHREYRRQHARALMALGLRLPVCDLCGDVLVWHEGNGGQWIGAIPPRDWMACHGIVSGPRHEVRTTSVAGGESNG